MVFITLFALSIDILALYVGLTAPLHVGMVVANSICIGLLLRQLLPDCRR